MEAEGIPEIYVEDGESFETITIFNNSGKITPFDGVNENSFIAKIKIDLNSGNLHKVEFGINNKTGERYKEIDVINIINASEIGYFCKPQKLAIDYTKHYKAHLLVVSMLYSLFEKNSDGIVAPCFIPNRMIDHVGNGVDSINNFVTFIKQQISSDIKFLYCPWLAVGHFGILAIDAIQYRQNDKSECMTYFEMGGMYIDDMGSIFGKNSSNENIEVLLDKIDKAFGAFAKNLEGYSSKKPFPVSYNVLVSDCDDYIQKQDESDCSYRAESGMAWLYKNKCDSYKTFKDIFSKEENMKSINNCKIRLELRAIEYYEQHYANVIPTKSSIDGAGCGIITDGCNGLFVTNSQNDLLLLKSKQQDMQLQNIIPQPSPSPETKEKASEIKQQLDSESRQQDLHNETAGVLFKL